MQLRDVRHVRLPVGIARARKLLPILVPWWCRNSSLTCDAVREGVAHSPSVAAVAISAHELGHALQDAEEYFPMRVRSMLVPAVNIGSNLGWILIMIGLVLRMTEVAWIGVAVFAVGALFALATLPVEFNASARAKQLLYQTGIIQTEEEQRGVNQVLNAAALTYVAGLITAVLQLLYYVFLVGRRRD